MDQYVKYRIINDWIIPIGFIVLFVVIVFAYALISTANERRKIKFLKKSGYKKAHNSWTNQWEWVCGDDAIDEDHIPRMSNLRKRVKKNAERKI